MIRSVINMALPLCGLAISLAVLVAGYLGGVWLPLDVLSHFRLHALAAAVVFALVAVSGGRLWVPLAAAGLVFFYLAVGFSWLAADKLSSPEGDLRAGERQVKLLSFNSWVLNEDLAAIEGLLRAENADVVVMQEFFSQKKPLLDRVADLYPFQAGCERRIACSLVVLAKYPIASSEISILHPRLPVLQARFGPELAGLTVVSVHTSRAPWIYEQQAQVAALARHVAQRKGPLIVAGDFNATPYSLIFQSFVRGSGLTGLQHWPSWPAVPLALPQLSIDHMFISEGVRPMVSPRPTQPAGSDHLPVVGQFAISGQRDRAVAAQ
ncbi:endonuclease/exonuclease/phosphatase family protein [Rhodoligotrophos defluvii]|uniref:endonuclease/exonuclease/phosphatase family protein n=1 Tax=Rhodoligotrophos defluvii TaxID=2561934 RepID=UPI0010C967DE|nr:endonuclease/exonuclease/phosphatase family protein [Rhodoligotrophos defluvii]